MGQQPCRSSQTGCCGPNDPAKAAQAKTSATHGFDLDENWKSSPGKPLVCTDAGSGGVMSASAASVSAMPAAASAAQPPEATPEAPTFPKLSEADGVSLAEFSSASGIYRGQINKNGDAHGHGVFAASTFQYEGQWRLGKHNGEGKQTWSDGRTFTGQFVDSQFWGHGRMTWISASGEIAYDGQYQADKKNGQGKMMWPSGKVYDGHWLEGLRHGTALITNKGIQTEEIWSHNSRADNGCSDKADAGGGDTPSLQ